MNAIIDVLYILIATLCIIKINGKGSISIFIATFGIIGILIMLTKSIEMGLLVIILALAYKSAMLYKERNLK